MSNVRNWAAGSAIAALILLSPAVAFLLAIAAEVLTDLFTEVGALAFLDLLPAVIIGWILFHKMASHSDVAVRYRRGVHDRILSARPVEGR